MGMREWQQRNPTTNLIYGGIGFALTMFLFFHFGSGKSWATAAIGAVVSAFFYTVLMRAFVRRRGRRS